MSIATFSPISPPCLEIKDGTLEALKWIALMLMTMDHINKYLFNETLSYLFEAGRLAMPIFVFVLAYNLARPGAVERGVYRRTMSRLALFGLLASPAFIAFGSLIAGWFPLNILFTLLVIAAVIALIECAQTGRVLPALAAILVFCLGGGVVEFGWPAVAFGVAAWWYCKTPSWSALMVALLACYSLVLVNGNQWAMAALPVIFGATRINLKVPRLRWFFYAYYPLHLFALLLIRIPMGQAGYVFF